MNFVALGLVLLLSLWILSKSAHLVISAITHIGHNLHISQFVTGFIILGIVTSTPEIFVGVQAAISGNQALSLGNLIGADIVLLTLICGLAALLARGVRVHESLGRLLQIAAVILAPIVLLLDLHLSRLDGVILLVIYLGYLTYVYLKRPPETSSPIHVHHRYAHTALLGLIGVVGLLVSSKAIILTATTLSLAWGVSPIIIGSLLLSVGTNLPEITLTWESIHKHRTSLIMGDILGSAATNTLVIAGLGLMSPFTVSEPTVFYGTSLILLLAMGVFIVVSHSKRTISVKEGLILLSLYVAFLIFSLSS